MDPFGSPWHSENVGQGASDEFPQLEEYAQYLSAVVDEESNPRVNAIAKVFGEALERAAGCQTNRVDEAAKAW